jgi:DNA-binding transcriptional LysR family regulator
MLTLTLPLPSFIWALAMVADSDLLAAVRRSLVREHAERFGISAVEPPVPFGQFRIHAVAREVAMMDAGVAWLMDGSNAQFDRV